MNAIKENKALTAAYLVVALVILAAMGGLVVAWVIAPQDALPITCIIGGTALIGLLIWAAITIADSKGW